MNRLRKAVTTMSLTAALMMAGGPALAHVCTNTNKTAGAGVGAVASIEVTTGEFTFLEGDLNPEGHIKGGFLTIIVLVGGEELTQFDSYAHLTLPEMARNAGPGDDMCDGKGVDDAEACVTEMLGL